MKRTLAVTLVLALAAFAAGAEKFLGTTGSIVRVEGTSTLHAWTMESPSIAGRIHAPTPDNWNAPASAVVTIPVTSIKSEHVKMDKLISTAERLLAQHRLSTDITSDEHLQWTVAVASVVEQGMKAIRNAVTEYTDDHGGRVEFADGSVFERKEIPTERPDLTKPGAEALVLAAGGSAAVDREPTVSWAALERTIGKPATKELRAQMSAAGATKKGSYPKYELVNAKKPRVPRRKREKLPETTGPEAA